MQFISFITLFSRPIIYLLSKCDVLMYSQSFVKYYLGSTPIFNEVNLWNHLRRHLDLFQYLLNRLRFCSLW